MKKQRYGKLTNIINKLYEERDKNNQDVFAQDMLSIAFNISYGRPIHDDAFTQILGYIQDELNTFHRPGNFAALAAALIEDVKNCDPSDLRLDKENYNRLLNKLQTWIVFS